VKGGSDKLIEDITELDLKVKEFRENHGYSLPCRSHIAKIEKNLEKKDISTLKKQIKQIENKISLFEEILSYDFSTMDTETPFEKASSLKELEKNLKENIKKGISDQKMILDLLENKAVVEDKVELSELNKVFQDVKSSYQKGSLRRLLKYVENFEEKVNEMIGKKKGDVREVLSKYHNKKIILEKKGAKGECIKKIQEKHDQIEENLEKGKYIQLLIQFQNFEELVNNAISKHKEFRKKLEEVRSSVLELPEKNRKKYVKKLKDIAELKKGYEKELERLERTEEKIRIEKGKARDILASIKYVLGESDFLDILSQKIGLWDKLKTRFENDDIAYILEKGEEHKKRLKDLDELFKTDKELLNEAKRLLDKKTDSSEGFEELSQSLDSIEERLIPHGIVEEKSATMDDYYGIYKKLLNSLRDDLLSIKEEIEKKAEQKGEEARARIESAREYLEEIENEEGVNLPSCWAELKRAEEKLQDKEFQKVFDLADSVIESVDGELKYLKNERKIRSIFEEIQPLAEKIEEDSLQWKINQTKDAVEEEDYEDEKVELAEKVKKEIKDYLDKKIDHIREEIEKAKRLDIKLDKCITLLDDAQEELTKENYLRTLEKSEESADLLKKRKNDYQDFKKKSESLREELQEIQESDISSEGGELIDRLNEMKDIDYPENALSELEEIEKYLIEWVDDQSKLLLQRIASLRTELKRYEEEGVLFDQERNTLEAAVELVNEVSSFGEREGRGKVIKAERKVKRAGEQVKTKTEKYKEWKGLCRKVKEKKERAEELGISIEETIDRNFSLGENPLELEEMEQKIERISSIENTLLEKLSDFEKDCRGKLEKLEEKVQKYRKEKCPFPFYLEHKDSIKGKLKEGKYEEAVRKLNELESRVERKIDSFEGARERKDLITDVFEKASETAIETEDLEERFQKLFNYDDYEKAKEDYDRLLGEMESRIIEYQEKLKKRLESLDERVTGLKEESHFEPVEVVHKIIKGWNLLYDDDSETKEKRLDELTLLPGIGREKAEELYEHGYRTLNHIKSSTEEDLQEVEKIGSKVIQNIFDSLDELDIERDERTGPDLALRIESLATVQEIIEEGTEKVEKFEKDKNRLMKNLTELEDAISQLKETGADITGLLEELSSVAEEGELETTVQKSEEILEKSKERLKDYRIRAENEIKEAEEFLEDKSKRGISLGKSEEVLEKAKEEIEKDLFKKAIRHAQESKNIAERTESEYEESKKKIEELDSKLQGSFQKRVYPVAVLARFEEMKDLEDYSEKKEKADELIRDIESKIREKKERIEGKIEAFSPYLRILEKEGINISKIVDQLEQAKKSAENTDLNTSLEHISKAYISSRKLKKEYDKSKKILKDTKNKLKFFEKKGIKTEDLMKRIEELEERGKYEKLITRCETIQDKLKERKSKKEQVIKGKIEDIERRIEESIGDGIALEDCIEELDKAKYEFEDEHYVDCIPILDKTEEMIEKRRSQYEELHYLVEEVNKKLNKAELSGLNFEYQEKHQLLEELKKSEDYRAAISELEEIKKELEGRIEEVKLKCYSKLEELTEEVERLKGKGMKIGINTETSDLEKGKKLFDQERYEDAHDKLKRGLEEAKERKESYRLVEIYFEMAKDLIESKSEEGQETERLKEKFMDAKTRFNSHQDVDQKIDALNEILKEEESTSINLLKEKSRKVKRSLLEKRKKNGLKSKQIESELRNKVESLERGELCRGIEHLRELQFKVEALEDKHKKFKKKMGKIKDLKENMKSLNILVSDIEENIEKARDQDDYRAAIKTLEETQRELADRVNEALSKKGRFIRQSRELIGEIKSQDFTDSIPLDLSKIEKKLSKAIKRRKERKIKEFFEKVQEVEDDIEETKDAYREGILKEKEKIQENLKELEDIEGPTEDFRSELLSIEEEAQQGDLLGLMKRLEGMEENIEERKEKTIERNELLQEVKEKLDELGEMFSSEIEGLPEQDLKSLKQKKDLKKSIEELEKLSKVLEGRKKEWIEEKQKKFKELRNQKKTIPDECISNSIEDLEAEVKDMFELDRYGEVKDKIKLFESTIQDCVEAWKNVKDRIELPFTHGIETELQIITQDGSWIEGEKMKDIFEHLLQEAKMFVYERVKEGEGPDYVLDKIHGIKVQKDKAGNDAVHVKYEVDGEKNWFSIIGKDSHVTTTTNILEIQTPPCQYLKELEWWLGAVFEASYRAVKKLGTGLLLISTAMNPVEGFSQGVTFGDHHHIGVPDDDTRRAVYNLLRNYIPHIIALSVNSSIRDGRVPEIKVNQNNSLISPMTPLSLRIENNIGQLACPPVLEKSDEEEDFLEKVSRDEESSRMVDLYPFTRFDTIEIRVSDTQLTLSDRISLAVLIQALAKKAKKRIDKGEEIPEAVPENILLNMRESVYKNGLLSPVRTGLSGGGTPLKDYYPDIEESAEGNPKFMGDATTSLLYWLKEEFMEMNVLDSQYLDPLWIKLYGPKSGAELGAPITSAQYQLYLLRENNHDIQKTLLSLDAISSRSAARPDYNPIIEEFGFPDVPKELTPTSLDIAVESTKISHLREDKRKVGCMVTVENLSDKTKKDIHLECEYVGDETDILSQERLDIPAFDKGEEKTWNLEKVFEGGEEERPVELVIEAYEEGNKLVSKKHPLPYRREIELDVTYTGPKLFHTAGEEVEIPYSIEIKNDHEEKIEGKILVMLEDEDGNEKDKLYTDIVVEERRTCASVLDVTADWALSALENQDYMEMPPLKAESVDGKEAFKIRVELDLDEKSKVAKKSDSFEIMG